MEPKIIDLKGSENFSDTEDSLSMSGAGGEPFQMGDHLDSEEDPSELIKGMGESGGKTLRQDMSDEDF